jgi:LysM repeat protein
VSIPGIVAVTGATVNCPSINEIGNQDRNFDPNELLTCNTSHTITQADLDAGSVTIVAIANVSGTVSPTATVSVPMIQNRLLTLTKTADPQTYDHVGQIITYTYVITNSGNITLNPAQFTGSDTAFEVPIACGEQNTRLAPKESLTCTATYTITQADMDAGSVTTSAVSSDNGDVISPAVSVTITRSGLGGFALPTNPSNLTPGITIQHTVVAGEWLWQIARCYGADHKQVIQANSQLADPDEISPGMIVSVPNIGSAGIIYGPPCIWSYTVQDGDTWNSIASKYDADLIVLQRVNPDGLAAGVVVKVPIHSASAP